MDARPACVELSAFVPMRPKPPTPKKAREPKTPTEVAFAKLFPAVYSEGEDDFLPPLDFASPDVLGVAINLRSQIGSGCWAAHRDQTRRINELTCESSPRTPSDYNPFAAQRLDESHTKHCVQEPHASQECSTTATV